MFKNTHQLLTGLSLAMAAILSPPAFAAPGANVQHLTFQTAMKPTGVTAGASGSVNGSITRQGNSFNQSLKISAAHLNPGTIYQLTAILGDDTNEVSVAEFTTDSKGSFKIA